MSASSRTGRAGTTKVRLIVVHGIGSQKVGSTAARWADSLVRFGRAAGHRPDVSTTTLNSDPARVTVRFLTVVPFLPPPVEEIAIEEAHWADSFPEPSVGRVLRFLATVAPVLAITQSLTIWRNRGHLWPAGTGSEVGRNPTSAGTPPAITTGATLQATGHIATMVGPLALGVLALGVAAPVIAVLLLVLLLAASLPISQVRQAVGKTLGWLSTSIGDAYLFVADPINRAAMEHRLTERLQEKSAVPTYRTVVLAHSQGAALAYRALGTMPEKDRPAAFITVGSGVGRLHQVGLLQTLPWYLTPLFVVIVATAATALAIWNELTFPLILLSMAVTFAVWQICGAWLDSNADEDEDLLPTIGGTSWLDIWASFDPVPNGRTAKDEGDTSYQLARVAGERSIVRDHVRYDLDWDQTMPLVFSRLGDPSSDEPLEYVGVRPPGDDVQGLARLRRIPLAARDWIGLGLRALPPAAITWVLVANRNELFSLGHWLQTAPPAFLGSTMDAVLVPLRSFSDFLEATWVRAPRPQELLAVLALLGLGLVGAVLTRRVLTFFQRRETTQWLAGGGLTAADGGPRWGDERWRNTRWGRARWPLALLVVALTAAVVPVFLLWADERLGGAGGERLDWTRAQTVEAYLTAVAEDDLHALCEITTPAVTARPFGAPGSADPCESDARGALRTCADGRKAVAALGERAFTVDPDGQVTVTWGPEVGPTCKDLAHWLALPTRVELVDGRWQITDVTDPPEEE